MLKSPRRTSLSNQLALEARQDPFGCRWGRCGVCRRGSEGSEMYGESGGSPRLRRRCSAGSAMVPAGSGSQIHHGRTQGAESALLIDRCAKVIQRALSLREQYVCAVVLAAGQRVFREHMQNCTARRPFELLVGENSSALEKVPVNTSHFTHRRKFGLQSVQVVRGAVGPSPALSCFGA